MMVGARPWISPLPASTVAAIVDPRTDVARASARQRQIAPALACLLGAQVIETQGGTRVQSRDRASAATDALTRSPADLLAVSGGWNPNIALSTHLGGRPRWSTEIVGFRCRAMTLQGVASSGAARGSFTLADALAEGRGSRVGGGRESAGHQGTALPAPKVTDDAPA